MTTPIDGRPISGPAYPSHSRDPNDLPCLEEIDRDLTTSRRLQVASYIYAAALTGSEARLDAAPGRLAEQAVAHADRLIRANDAFRPVPPPAAPAPSLSLAAVRLLVVMCQRGRMEPWEQRDCPPATRELLKTGVAAYSTPLGDLVPTPEGIALMRGESWTQTSTATTASTVPAA